MKNVNLNDNSTKGYKLRLYPTKEQEHLFYKYFGLSRFVYNLCIDLQEKYNEECKELNDSTKHNRISYEALTIKFTNLKKEEKYIWFNDYSVDSIRGAIRDCCKAFKFHDSNPKHYKNPKFKSRKHSKKQFSVRNDTLAIKEDFVQIPSIGNVKYCNSYGNEILGSGFKNHRKLKYIHYYNPRISFDGLNFYLSFAIPKDQDHQVNSYWNYSNNIEWKEQESSNPIGIDVGLINEKWLVDSTGIKVERPNSNILNKKIARLQRKYARQKKANLKKNSSFMEQHPNGSKNMQKTRAKINKCEKKITNRRHNTVHEYACSLLKKKPKAMVIETLSPQNMINNHNKKKAKNKLNQMIYDAALTDTITIIKQKMNNNGILVIEADPDYPSSQICSCCGYRHNIGRAKYYRCPNCGTVIDRDINAAINLSRLAY